MILEKYTTVKCVRACVLLGEAYTCTDRQLYNARQKLKNTVRPKCTTGRQHISSASATSAFQGGGVSASPKFFGTPTYDEIWEGSTWQCVARETRMGLSRAHTSAQPKPKSNSEPCNHNPAKLFTVTGRMTRLHLTVILPLP